MEYYYTNMQEKLLHAGHGQNETIQGIVLLDRYYMMGMPLEVRFADSYSVPLWRSAGNLWDSEHIEMVLLDNPNYVLIVDEEGLFNRNHCVNLAASELTNQRIVGPAVLFRLMTEADGERICTNTTINMARRDLPVFAAVVRDADNEESWNALNLMAMAERSLEEADNDD